MKTTEKKLLSNEEIASFCSQAAMLFQAGIPPVEGMAILQSDAQSPEGKAIFEEILTVCRQGESFHKALEATKVFPDYCLHMIALGEESGNLDVCMSSLADYYEKEDAIAGSIRDAVTYPFIMIAMMAAVIVVLVSRVMPIFEQVYIELGSEMTGFAASLLRLGNHLNRYSFIFVSILCIWNRLLHVYFEHHSQPQLLHRVARILPAKLPSLQKVLLRFSPEEHTL